MSLTSHLKDVKSPVRQWLLDRFPKTRPLLAELKIALADAPTIRQEGSVNWSLSGMAIDYRLRGYFEPLRFTGLPTIGIRTIWSLPGAQFPLEVQQELENQPRSLASVGRRLEREQEEWLARFSFVLSLFEVVYRSGVYPPEIASLSPDTISAKELLAIPKQAWVDDLCNMSWAFYDQHADLLSKPVILNPTFDGSRDVGGADADLVLDGCLIDIKATINTARFQPWWLHQLLGYVLLDYDDRLGIDKAGIYFARQARLVQWPLDELLVKMGESELPPLAELRAQFKQVTRTER